MNLISKSLYEKRKIFNADHFNGNKNFAGVSLIFLFVQKCFVNSRPRIQQRNVQRLKIKEKTYRNLYRVKVVKDISYFPPGARMGIHFFEDNETEGKIDQFYVVTFNMNYFFVLSHLFLCGRCPRQKVTTFSWMGKP